MENHVLFRKFVPDCLALTLGILEKFTNLFDLFWSQNAKDIKQNRK
jgi:hypothetical protein